MAATPAPISRARRVAIAGASSLRGKELREMLEASRLGIAEVRLLDEEFAAGTLTEAGGEPALIQAVAEDSFENSQAVFFSGSPEFAKRNWAAAVRAGAAVIDLSGGLGAAEGAQPWIPTLDDAVHAVDAHTGHVFLAPGAPTIVACSLSGALSPLGMERMAAVFFEPVSERGQAGIEELENQTVKLLSFQPIAQEVFDTQVAFNLLDRFGAECRERFADVRERAAREIQNYLAGRAVIPAVQFVQAPVFYSYAFSLYVEFSSAPAADKIEAALNRVCVLTVAGDGTGPSNVSVAGENRIHVARMEHDPNVARGWWLWGAADNLRLAAANAVEIAARILG